MRDWEEAARLRLERRALLRGALAAPVLGGLWMLPAEAQEARPGGTTATGGLIPRTQEPVNLEFPFSTLDRFLIPNERFYVRNHFRQPELDRRGWSLRVEGAVRQPLTLTYADLLKLPSRTLAVTLECAGNGRSLLNPKTRGVQWDQGAVGNAEWTGVPLAAVLERAGVRKGAVDVVLEGADRGTVATDPPSPGEISFARSLPLEKALRGDVLLAYRMNGADLPRTHGFPLRAVVPGWYGVASVKWLTRIVVAEQPFQGYFQSFDYTYWHRPQGVPTLTPLQELQVKAQIARPAAGEVVPVGSSYRIHGAAWTGAGQIRSVEVSTDGGASWAPARLTGPSERYAWRLWEYDWRPSGRAGRRHVLMARATDSAGRRQPLERDPDRRNYMISHVLPVEVEVR